MAKLFATEMLARVTDNAVQIFGGMGLMEEMPLERLWRDARVERIWDGTSEIQRHIISRSLLRPARELRPMFTIPNAAGRAPVIETERLRLRGHWPDGFRRLPGAVERANVYRHITGKPGTEGEAWARILRYIGHWSALGFGYWAVEDKATGQFVGEVGFADYKREIEPPLTGMPELGWVMTPARHGQGYGTEAVGAAVAWGDAHFGSRRMCCIAAPENTASLRLAAKFGFREVLRTTYLGDPTIMFIRERTSRRFEPQRHRGTEKRGRATSGSSWPGSTRPSIFLRAANMDARLKAGHDESEEDRRRCPVYRPLEARLALFGEGLHAFLRILGIERAFIGRQFAAPRQLESLADAQALESCAAPPSTPGW